MCPPQSFERRGMYTLHSGSQNLMALQQSRSADLSICILHCLMLVLKLTVLIWSCRDAGLEDSAFQPVAEIAKSDDEAETEEAAVSDEPSQQPAELTQQPVELTEQPVELTQEPVESSDAVVEALLADMQAETEAAAAEQQVVVWVFCINFMPI